MIYDIIEFLILIVAFGIYLSAWGVDRKPGQKLTFFIDETNKRAAVRQIAGVALIFTVIGIRLVVDPEHWTKWL